MRRVLGHVATDMVADVLRQFIKTEDLLDTLGEMPTPSEVAKALGVSKSTVSRYIRELDLPVYYYKGSDRPRLKKAEVLEIIIQDNTRGIN